jgi:hypothetical protein
MIEGEGGLRYHVESRSDPKHPHMVDLSCFDGFGQCSCKRWQCDIWPVIRDGEGRKHTKQTTCAHVRAALHFFLDLSLTLWIQTYGQGNENGE